MSCIGSNEIYDEYKNKQAVYDRYYRKQIEERLRMKERTKEMQMIMDQGQGYVDKIHESNDIIKDKIISQKLVQKFLNKWTIFLFCSILFSSNQKEH